MPALLRSICFSLVLAPALWAKPLCIPKDSQLKAHPLMGAFVQAESLSIGEELARANTSPSEEFISRLKIKGWDNFEWKLSARHLVKVRESQMKYQEVCDVSGPSMADILAQDLRNGMIPEKSHRSFFRVILLYLPCTTESERSALGPLLTKEFYLRTESFLDLVVATESEVPGMARDYALCDLSKSQVKFALSDALMNEVAREAKEKGLDSSFANKIKRLRSSHMHFESAKNIFNRIDALGKE